MTVRSIRAWPWFVGFVIVVAIFQLFFRYEYVRVGSAVVYRIDRLTGHSCEVPCDYASPPEPQDGVQFLPDTPKPK